MDSIFIIGVFRPKTLICTMYVVHFRFSKKATYNLPVGFKVYLVYFKSYGMVKRL